MKYQIGLTFFTLASTTIFVECGGGRFQNFIPPSTSVPQTPIKQNFATITNVINTETQSDPNYEYKIPEEFGFLIEKFSDLLLYANGTETGRETLSYVRQVASQIAKDDGFRSMIEYMSKVLQNTLTDPRIASTIVEMNDTVYQFSLIKDTGDFQWAVENLQKILVEMPNLVAAVRIIFDEVVVIIRDPVKLDKIITVMDVIGLRETPKTPEPVV